MAASILHPQRPMKIAVALWAMIAVAGCSRSSEKKEEMPQGRATVSDERKTEPLASTSQTVPSGLTDVPELPRHETPQPRIGNAFGQPAEPGDGRRGSGEKSVSSGDAPAKADGKSASTDGTSANSNGNLKTLSGAPAKHDNNRASRDTQLANRSAPPINAAHRLADVGSGGSDLPNPLRDHVGDGVPSGSASPRSAPANSAARNSAPPDSASRNSAPPDSASRNTAPPSSSPPNGTSSKNTPSSRTPSTTDRPRKVKRSDVPFDPIQVNGSIFDGWPKPKLAFVITGMEEGYIEPCGCAGIDRMKGGMTRRYTLFKQLRKEGWPVVGLDVGGIARGYGQQAVLKFGTMIEGKREMGYQAIALGASDLKLPAGDLASFGGSVSGQPSLFISANVALLEWGIIDTTRIVDVAGMKIGITAVLGEQYQKAIRGDEVKMLNPVAALRKVVPDLKRKAGYLVLLAHATKKESMDLGKMFPEFNVVVTAEGFSVPPDGPETILGTNNLLIQVGHEGMHAIVLGLFNDRGTSWRYQRVPLDSRFPAAPEMKLLMAAYQEQLKSIGFAGLGLHAVPHPQKATNGKVVGSKQCESCHEISYDIWKKSGHGHAYETLVNLKPPRNFDRECVSCHVTGWHPTKFFPYEGGYESETKTPLLVNTGCDDCHGPGEKHVAVELSGSEADRQKFRKAVRVTKAEAEEKLCITCHDGENSPEFDFKTYWPLIEHKEKE